MTLRSIHTPTAHQVILSAPSVQSVKSAPNVLIAASVQNVKSAPNDLNVPSVLSVLSVVHVAIAMQTRLQALSVMTMMLLKSVVHAQRDQSVLIAALVVIARSVVQASQRLRLSSIHVLWVLMMQPYLILIT